VPGDFGPGLDGHGTFQMGGHCGVLRHVTGGWTSSGMDPHLVGDDFGSTSYYNIAGLLLRVFTQDFITVLSCGGCGVFFSLAFRSQILDPAISGVKFRKLDLLLSAFPCSQALGGNERNHQFYIKANPSLKSSIRSSTSSIPTERRIRPSEIPAFFRS